MPKLRVIIKPPPEPQGDAEQQTAALRDYLLQMSEELAYVLTHLEADNINDSTFERIQGMIPRPYTGLPVMDGDASSGQSEQWARGDHRHGHDSTKADVTALEETADDLAAHIDDKDNPHEVTKAQVGLDQVANERQYSAQNPPPIPTPVQVGAIPTTEKGSAGGVAELDSNGMVPSAQLPSYVDDVLNYPTLADFPAIGEDGKIYVAKDTNKQYRWSGIDYVQISESLALGETSSTAYRGDRGKTAYDHSQVTSGNPHNVTAAEVGARPDTWTPSAADVGAQPSITANGILKGDGLGGVSAASAGTDYQAPLTAGTDYQTPLVAGTDYATPGMIPSVPDPSDASPQDLGTADAGSSGDYSRADHVHNMPDAEDVPYDNTGSGLMATDVQAAIDEIAQGGGGGGTAASAVSYDNTGSGMSATNVQDAIDEVLGDIPAVPSPSDAAPQDLGTAAAGSSGDYSRADHVHKKPTAADIGAYVKPSGGIPASDLANGVIPTVPPAYTSDPAMDGTASPGSSGAWAKGDHVHPSDTSRVPVYGLGKNLLDNAYFVGGGSQLGDGVFPINQRGQTSYSGTGYGIDRWKQTNSNIQQVVRSDCLRMNAVSAVSTGNNIFCYFFCPKLPAGTYTLSFLVKEATGSGGWYYSSNASAGYGNVGNVKLLPGLVTKTFTATGNETSQVFYLWHQGALAVGDHLDIIAAKLECGSEQTLAHQENNAWVLNEIPDYGEELSKCQRYYFDTGANSTNGQIIIGLSNASGQVLSLIVPVPVSMNEANAMTITGTIGWVRGEGGAIGGYSLQSGYVVFKNAIAIGVNASYGGMRTYAAYFTKLVFSAEP